VEAVSAHPIDVVCEFGAFVLVYRMADVGIRALDSDLARSRG
jgi:hypothetical protein